ncbi:flagellar motor switch protein FliN [Qipengyuania sp. DY56-A-20]|jgi:flagellar motor switch protein FliN/FliY|uniref:Flagellar motor switch protein FliN n=1 Tax=Qipengyuania benthica TaxID=3067651 RepID=A0ABT9H5F2_9SPHN|nr:flagellar motor switch protein FliN [Qipengyuania sp. DY56-A-20]MDP4538549.1 flagellar motor switch protein FliN [Qipengyuania sp. DY56-A-20]
MSLHADGFGLIQDIDVRLTVELGRKQMRLRDVLALGESSFIELDRLTDEPLDILVNGKMIARGEVVAQGNRFAIRVLELVGASSSGGAAPTAIAEPKVEALQ